MNTSHTVVTLALTGLGFLAACGGDGPGTEPITTITVSGLVRERGGDPISGAVLVVAGKNPVTSDADGRFSIPGVVVPYDLTLLLSSRNTALIYKGLTRADPALLYFDRIGPHRAPRSAARRLRRRGRSLSYSSTAAAMSRVEVARTKPPDNTP
jgi:hypothetical protein